VGKEHVEKRPQDGQPRWPFDPLQPGDHEPVRLPEDLERLQKEEKKER
jgi:hypothetical protein